MDHEIRLRRQRGQRDGLRFAGVVVERAEIDVAIRPERLLVGRTIATKRILLERFVNAPAAPAAVVTTVRAARGHELEGTLVQAEARAVHVRGLAAGTAEHGDLDVPEWWKHPGQIMARTGAGHKGEGPKVRRSDGPKVRRSSIRRGYRAGSNGLRTVTPP